MRQMLQGQIWQTTEELILQAVSEYPADTARLILNQPTGDFFYDTWVIKDEYKDTVWHWLLMSLPYAVGEARVIKLVPGESYMSHADIDNRWHLNLSGNNAYLMDLDAEEMFKLSPDLHWHYMDASRHHVASNFGSVDRLQLVVREPLKQSNITDLVCITIEPATEQHDYRYKFDNTISPWLNHANANMLLADFKFERSTVTFKLSVTSVEEFKEILTDAFTVTIG